MFRCMPYGLTRLLRTACNECTSIQDLLGEWIGHLMTRLKKGGSYTMVKEHSSFVIQPYRRAYIRDYCARMSVDNTVELWDDCIAKVLEEQGYSIQSAPRSVYRVEKLYEALARYEPNMMPKVDMRNKALRAGINLAYTCFAKPRDDFHITPMTFDLEDVHSITSNPKGSAGLTAFGLQKKDAEEKARADAIRISVSAKSPDPCVAFKRTQFGDKTRLVWGYPYSMTVIEGVFARPLIQRFKNGITPMAFGMSTGLMGTKLRVSSYRKKFAYSVDASSFDSGIASELISAAFRILETWFDLSQVEPNSSISYRKIWNKMVRYFIQTPIVMPDGNVYKGKAHGVPSGSYFTQMIDSIVNVIICGAMSFEFSLNVSKEDIYVLGDDLLFWSNRAVKLDHVTSFATRLFGLRFNAEKSHRYSWDEPILYLGRVWDCGVPDLATDEILKRMTQPETFRKYSRSRSKREVEERLLVLSYAAVYRSGFPILMDFIGPNQRYHQTVASLERFIRKGYTEGGEDPEMNPDALSGLMRFLKKYREETQDGGSPLALQYWK